MTWTIAIAAGWGVLVGGLGGALTRLGPWYYALRKPSWQPPDWLFGPAWTLILGLAAWAAVLAWNGSTEGAMRARVITLFAVNGTLNVWWSVLFFFQQRPDRSLIEVVALWLSLVALIVGLAPASHLASWLIVPYLLWVSFAAFLNLTIVRLNRPFQRA